MKYPIQRTGIGQDSHRFETDLKKPCMIGGIQIEDCPGFDADSDGDIVYHAICNAISSLTHVPILGDLAIQLCKEQDIRDSKIYLMEAFKTLKNEKIVHIALTIEGKRPRLQKFVDAIRHSVSEALALQLEQVGLTITSGDMLTDFGKGLGAQCFCILSTIKAIS